MFFSRLISIFMCFFGISYAVDSSPLVLVSVAAYQEVVQEMAGNEIRVQSVVPAGMSFHTFEPTPGQVVSVCSAKLWFTIGVSFEKMILKAVHGTSTPPDIIDLRTGLALIHDTVCQCSDGGADTHIWTSPRMMKTQLNTIRDALVAAFPSQKQGIEARYGGLVQRIDSSIAYADEKLKGSSGKIIVISHGAYDYLCHDYGIIQRAIEVGGKEAATRSLYALINEAKERGVKTVFSLKQYPKRGIERVAEALGAQVIELDAYQTDYFGGLTYAVDAFHMALEQERG